VSREKFGQRKDLTGGKNFGTLSLAGKDQMQLKHVTYFILAPEAGKVKIGQCTETHPPTKRLKSLQTGSPEYLEVLLLLPHTSPFEETQLHCRFSQYRTQGEWFEYRGELKSFVEKKIQNPKPTEDDDLRSFNGCISEIRTFDYTVLGSDRDKRSYQLYVDYCKTVDCSPAPYEKWLKISDNPVEYGDIGVKVSPYAGKTGNPNTTRAHTHEPYTRWESSHA
jgi:Meiotically up-regulated gene 113